MTKHKQKTHQGRPIGLLLVGLTVIGVVITMLVRTVDVAVFNPKGFIANEQFNLIIFSVALMMIIAVPTLFMVYFFAWKYRESNTNAVFEANTGHGKRFNTVMWVVPTVFVIILACVMWVATHRLEPKKTIVSDKKPITIQVIALRWKWLFVYPEQQIATVNFLQVPEDTPIQFDLTADEAPMSSFWIPHWGGQLYAMTGHHNRLNLIADTIGDFPGSSAEINGRGFAGMKFTARSSSDVDFNAWVEQVRKSPKVLSSSEYEELLKPSENNQVADYASYDIGLYDKVLMKYQGGHSDEHSSDGHEEAGH